MSPTLKDIADHLGVTPATVSYALHGSGRVSVATRKRVQDTARRLGYRPNLAARALRGSTSRTIGLLTATLNIESTTAKLEAFDIAARRERYIPMMAVSPNDPALEDELIRSLRDRQIDGIVIYPTETGQHLELRKLVRENFPVVTIDGAGRLNFETSDVTTSYYGAGQLQAKHLSATGCRRPCHLNTTPDCYTKAQLRAGFVDACREAGIDPVLVDIEVNPLTGIRLDDEVVQQLESALAPIADDIDSIASYDLMALAALHVATRIGKRVPDDWSLIGFDDSSISANALIPITTIAQPSHEVGQAAFHMLLDLMNNPDDGQSPRRVVVTPRLISRRSTRPLQGARHARP